VLVDHNETAQSVDGIEEADVVEILDHHRLGSRTTALPITFINRVVGSTCTIVADLYRTNNATPPAATPA
jgi:manganese-dependent inorganic pyrophosphatase